jgi:release factor glutamine methyltransferase
MNRGDARHIALGRLKDAAIPRPGLEADLLCEEAFGCSREELLAHPELLINQREEQRLLALMEARGRHCPMAYLTGRASFWGLDLEVGPGCLIPRPETELLIETALDWFHGGRFLDWGTGSGCVALALLSERENSRALMLEKNPPALRWAWRNLKRFPFLDRALLWHGASIESVPSAWLPFDLIVGNPPYIPSSEIPSLMADVRLYEPKEALDGGRDGLDDVKAILRGAVRALVPGGLLLLEIGGNRQAEELKRFPAEELEVVQVKKDLSGTDRIVVWRHR